MIVIDQLKRIVEIKTFPPQKIISLVPSISELLWGLGLKDNICAITKFCIHPQEMHQSKPHIGGTKILNIEKIKLLNPDLIIGNKEENTKEQIEELEKHFPTWISDVNTFEDAIDMIKQIGTITHTQKKAECLITEIDKTFFTINTSHKFRNKKILYLIWYKPYMAVGANTFIHDLIDKIGAINVFGAKDRYKEITIEEINQVNPDYILLSSEPFPFSLHHAEELREHLCNAQTQILLVNGEMFSWYGSRMKYFSEYFNQVASIS